MSPIPILPIGLPKTISVIAKFVSPASCLSEGEKSYLVALACSLPVDFITDPLRHSFTLVVLSTVLPTPQLTSSSSSKKQTNIHQVLY